MVATASAEAPASRSVGRPSDFTPANRASILASLRRGHTRKSACGKIRISYSTFNHWLTRGKDEPASAYGQFLEEVTVAEQEGNAALVDTWIDQTVKDNRAVRSLLAIKDPETYSEQRILRVQHEGTVQHTHVHTLALPDPDQWTQLAGLLGAPVIDGDAQEVAPPDLGDM